VAFLILNFKEEGLIANNVGMPQLFNIDEIVFQINDVFSIHPEGFGGELFA